MAVKKTIEIEATTDDAVKEINKLKKQVEQLNKTVVENNKDTEKSLKGVENASKSTASGVKAIGTTLKAIGIGLLLSALGTLQDLFNSNQKAVDIFDTAFESVSIAFNDFVKFIDSNFGTISDFFKEIFENPTKTVKELGEAIKNNIIERFNSALEVAGLLGKAFKQIFSGDFSGALETAKQASVEFVDVLVGVDDSLKKGVNGFIEINKNIMDYTNGVVDSAKANVELRKQSELLEIVNQGLIESYDIQAEKLRQTRDDDRLTIEERIKANNELMTVLQEQQKVMIENADKRIQVAQIELNKDKNNQEARLAFQTALNEKKAIEAQVTGFLSEQKINEIGLERELQDLKQSDIDASSERYLAEKTFNAELIEDDVKRIESLINLAEEEERIETERLTTKRDLYKEGTQAYVDANNELLNAQLENSQKQKGLQVELSKFKQAVEAQDIKRNEQAEEAKANAIRGSLGAVAGLIDESSGFGKGIAVSQAIISTYAGATKALEQGGLFGAVGAAAIIASGLGNVKNIVSTKKPPLPSFAKGGGSSGGGSANINASVPPAFNVVGQSVESQLAESISNQQNQPVQAYVVSSDVSTAQELDRNIVRGASL